MKITLVILTAALLAASWTTPDKSAERGKYLAEHVANCQQCHTRRLANGDFDSAAWLKGAALSKSHIAPDITPGGAFWNRFGERGMLQFLISGRKPDGKSAGVMMPHYRLRRDDAQAIVAYLKSIK